MKPTLLVLSAGMGNRFGGLKQISPIGPNSEPLIDYSIHDAISAGFKKVVFVIRECFHSEFRAKIGSRIEKIVETEYVFQELNKNTSGYEIPEERIKPWGTGHATLVCKDVINDPFLVINSDDYYGAEAYQQIIQHFLSTEVKDNNYAMIGYKISDTISKFGSVSRGVCEHDSGNNLVRVVERTKIREENEGIFYYEKGKKNVLFGDQLVSMNIWGFKPEIFGFLQEEFNKFLAENSKNLQSEFFIPTVVNQLLEEKKIKVKILPTTNDWFGLTYKEDVADAVSRIDNLIKLGKYPKVLT